MKKFATLALTVVAMCALTACGGTKVSAEKFTATVAELEDHEYSSATVTYKEVSKGTGAYEDQSGTESGTINYTYSDGAWSSEDEGYEDYIGLLVSIKGTTFTDVDEDEASMYDSYSVTYYINPLKMSAKASMSSYDDDGNGMSMSMNGYETFNKYGYCTKTYSKVNMETKGELLGVSLDGTLKVESTVSISYK